MPEKIEVATAGEGEDPEAEQSEKVQVGKPAQPLKRKPGANALESPKRASPQPAAHRPTPEEQEGVAARATTVTEVMRGPQGPMDQDFDVWLYHKRGASKCVKKSAFAAHVADGWRDHPNHPDLKNKSHPDPKLPLVDIG